MIDRRLRATRSASVLTTLVLSLAAAALGTRPVHATPPEPPPTPPTPPTLAETLAGLTLRNIGPAKKSGRIADLALDPTDRGTWYVAVASGGVWKTVNSGTTWTPIFDDYGAYSIGCVTLDPHNPQVVWVGTGENNSQRSAGYGDGVYKSLDGGETFTRMGLDASEHIGKIVVDPRDSDTVYVAAQGPLWAPGGDRGLYKTTDGGISWTRVLHVSDDTGVTDVVLDPRDPEVLYAASFQRRRRVWALVAGGPESAIHKSTDGGATWRRLERGLPTGPLGRIGLAISPMKPDVLYATIAATPEESGFYRSANRGESWTKTSDWVSIDPQYYQELFPDPHRFDRVYAMDVIMQVTDDGGRTFADVPHTFKHVDNHALAFDPHDPDYLLNGCDGGLYESWDRGATWKFVANLPVTQFYRVGIDNQVPFYNVYGGTQDNDTLGGPARTSNVHGIRNSDWWVTVGGDGYQTRVDPTNPDLLYSMWQYGHLVRYDRRSGQVLDIQPQPAADEPPLVWNWDSPLLLSPHSPTRLYFAANRLFRSDDRGDSWTAVSGDLTRGLDRNQLPVMGRTWSVDAVWKNVFTSFYGNATALDESPLEAGLLYVGTDDGLVHVSENGGETWRTVERFPGVPERTYVSDLHASRHDADVVFALFNNHKSGDFTPYALRSDDRGRTWVSIAGDLGSDGLPARHVTWSIVQDHEMPSLLVVGTEFGLFVTRDGGASWAPLRGGVPIVAFRDLEIHQGMDDLVAASFGRGLFVLDDMDPLRRLTPTVLTAEASLLPVRDAWAYLQDAPLGWGEKDVQGDAFFTAPNPPFGAVFTYHLRDGYTTRRASRLTAEAEARAEGADVRYPPWEDLRTEDRELAPAVVLTVRDAAGAVVARVHGPHAAGLHRVAWNLRYPSLRPTDDDEPAHEAPAGPMALPGAYTVTLSKRIDGRETVLTEPVAFDVRALGRGTLDAEDPAAVLAFRKEAEALGRAVRGAYRALGEAEATLGHLRRALDRSTADADVFAALRAAQATAQALRDRFEGDTAVARRAEPSAPSMFERLDRVTVVHWMSQSATTETHTRELAIAKEAFERLLTPLRQLIEVEVPALETKAEAAGAPWTPGRGVPAWPTRDGEP